MNAQTTQTRDEQFLSQFQFGAIRFNEWKQKYQGWLESAEFRSGKNQNAPEFLAQDAFDVLWFSTVQEAEKFCKKFGFEPVITKTVYHTSGQVFWNA